MSRVLKIAIADDETDLRDYLRETLSVLGHQVVGVAATGRELVEQVRSTRPDLVITDIKMPEIDGIDAAIEIYQDGPIPIILVSAYHDRELVSRAGESHVLAYLVKPIGQQDLETAISIVMSRFEQFQDLRRETDDLRQAMEDRKIIERAKGILMQRVGLSEDEAYRRLNKTARDGNRKLRDVA
ncbi:MAG TPA: response regulator, partial [Pirellulales bacterium]|nr:response regulator [Pirellulales bacterium]